MKQEEIDLYTEGISQMNVPEFSSRILVNATLWRWFFYFRWRAKHIGGKRVICEWGKYQ